MRRNRKTYQETYYQKNIVKIKNYYEKNKEKIINRSKQYYKDNLEIKSLYNKIYYEKNKDQILNKNMLEFIEIMYLKHIDPLRKKLKQTDYKTDDKLTISFD